MNFGIRYPQDTEQFETNYRAWSPRVSTLEKYIQNDIKCGDYGKNTHQFIPKDYVIS